MNKKITKSLLILFLIFIGLNTLYAVDNTTTSTDNTNIKEDPEIIEDTPYTIDITQDNYHDYFTTDNELNQSKLKSNTQLNIHSIPDNTQEIDIYEDDNSKITNITISGADNLTLYNTAITVTSSFKNFKLANITLNYNQSYEEGAFLYIENTNNTENYILENININCIQNKPTYPMNIHPVEINGKNIHLKNLNINAKLPSNTISYQGTDNKPRAIALYIQGENITLNNSNITVIENDKDLYSNYNTIYALYNEADYFTMTNTKLYIEGEEYVYAVVARSNNTQINNNQITTKSIVYAAGINIEGTNIQNNNITRNHINITAGEREQGTTPNGAEDSAYGLILLDYSYKGGKYTPNQYSINNTTYTYNTITGQAGNIYAIEVFGGTNTNISNNNIKITGRTPMAIGAIGENITINNNNITSKGQTNNTEGSADYLKPRTTGIYTYLSNKGITINNNTINTRRGRGIYIEQTNNTKIINNQINTNKHDYTIEITGNNNTIKHNYLLSRNHEANNSIKATENNTIQNNTNKPLQPIYTININNTNKNNKINITATITLNYETMTNLSKGKVTFKVNRKTLKDENGKVIYAKVVNGTATIENYIVPSDWTKEGTTIQAVYSGSTQCDKLTSEKTNITINKEAPTLTIDSIEPIAAGSTITLKASITDNNKEINTGKIVFKINGKTVKDENGKVIYAKVVNGQVSVNYRLPESYKAGNYTITATYIGTDYDKLTSENTISIIKT